MHFVTVVLIMYPVLYGLRIWDKPEWWWWWFALKLITGQFADKSSRGLVNWRLAD